MFAPSSHRPEEHATYFETTNQYFYDRKPMAAQELYQTDPLPEKGDDARYIGECACIIVEAAYQSCIHIVRNKPGPPCVLMPCRAASRQADTPPV